MNISIKTCVMYIEVVDTSFPKYVYIGNIVFSQGFILGFISETFFFFSRFFSLPQSPLTCSLTINLNLYLTV